MLIATHPVGKRQLQSLMPPVEVVIKDLQVDERIKSGVPFGEGMRLASERMKPIAESAVNSFDMDGTRFGNHLTQSSTNLNSEQLPMLIPMRGLAVLSARQQAPLAGGVPASPIVPADDRLV